MQFLHIRRVFLEAFTALHGSLLHLGLRRSGSIPGRHQRWVLVILPGRVLGLEVVTLHLEVSYSSLSLASAFLEVLRRLGSGLCHPQVEVVVDVVVRQVLLRFTAPLLVPLPLVERQRRLLLCVVLKVFEARRILLLFPLLIEQGAHVFILLTEHGNTDGGRRHSLRFLLEECRCVRLALQFGHSYCR